jgi:hypothetical protein
MTRRFSWLPIVAGLALASLAGCPDNPYKAETWTKKLGDSHESERAVTELEQLGDPSAIEPLGEAWVKQGKPGRLLQVIISLARPLTPKDAEEKFFTDYAQTGRPASWDKALPYLKRAISEVDEANTRSTESAIKAAEALGESQQADGLDVLIELAQKPVTKKLVTVQIAAVRAIGKFSGESGKASAALIKLIDREAPPSPRTEKSREQMRAVAEKYEQHLAISGAAVNALSDLHVASAAKTLVLAMYRTPELFAQVRRALVASGPTAEAELRKAVTGGNPEVNQLFRDKKLDKYCGDRNDAPADQCQPVSAMYFYAAVVLGDFYDPKSVPDLLAVLKTKPLPVYYADDSPSPNTQFNAVFDALRKIGSPEGAGQVREMWEGKGIQAGGAPAAPAGKKGAAAASPAASNFGGPEVVNQIRTLAVGAYPFLVRDEAGADEIGKIAADNAAEGGLRQEAAAAFARLSRDSKDIAVFQSLAQKYFDDATKKNADAATKKPAADAADKEFEKFKTAVDAAKKAATVVTVDKTKSVADIKAATAAVKDAEAKRDAQQAVHDKAAAPYVSAQALAKRSKGFARLFQTQIGEIEIAIRCKDNLDCYAKSLKLTNEEVAKNNKDYIRDIGEWTKDELTGLREANIERAMLEVGKAGTKAAGLTDALLDGATSDDRLIRQSILLALPKIAKVPCANCETKLQAVIKAGEGKTTLADLNLETTMMKNFFGWAGGKSPSSASDKDELPTPNAPKAPPAKRK